MTECYCQWVDGMVDSDKMPEKPCNLEFILNNAKCTKCEKSLQLEYMTPKELLRNIYIR
jgi:hypothetical protein